MGNQNSIRLYSDHYWVTEEYKMREFFSESQCKSVAKKGES